MRKLKKQLFFYMKSKEITDVLTLLENENNISVYKAGLLEDYPKEISLKERSNFSENIFGDWNLVDQYLILPKEAELAVRKVVQKNGNVLYSVDQLENPVSLILFKGGEFKDSAIIASKIGTIVQGDFQNKVLTDFLALLKKACKKFKGWYVSNEINPKIRLTTSYNSTTEYDLDLGN